VVAAAADAVGTMLARSGSTTILATSREPLGVDGERAHAVTPLSLEGGVTSDAVTLFVDRARTVRPDFGLAAPDTVDAVVDICTTVDGLPLGIELAAARMAAMSAVEVRDRLADRFRLLRGSTPRPDRQLTLRHAVEWSYDLLDDAERALLRVTSVFAGGFELASISAIVEDDDDIDVLHHLDSLVRKSLVVADLSAPRTRYRLFETPRTSHRSPWRAGSTGTGPAGAPRSTGWRQSSATCGPRTAGPRRAVISSGPPTSPRTPH
jgi:predicted ATPase